ncbi:probable peroxygenase 4 [Manihot esculenta]|nr:probable peroxygenase 4 [Manihot esculenta]
MDSTTSITSDKQAKEKFKPDEHIALQKHVFFFDRNQDGVVYPWETFQGFRAIGCNLLVSAAGAFLINVAFSQKTRPGKLPSLLFPIEVQNIHLSKHGSDTDIYDEDGRFVNEKFETIFRNHARTHPDALTLGELMGMLKANREAKDYFGWVAGLAEWTALYIFCKDSNGLLKKETVRALYDGSLFEEMEKKHKASAKK